MKEKDIKEIVKAFGLDYNTWSEEIVNEKRLQIIDKDKAYFNGWREDVLKDAVVSLMIQKVHNNYSNTKEHHSSIKYESKDKHD